MDQEKQREAYQKMPRYLNADESSPVVARGQEHNLRRAQKR